MRRKSIVAAGLVFTVLFSGVLFQACEKQQEQKPTEPAKKDKAPAQALESVQLLESIYTAQSKYFKKHGSYSKTFRELGWEPEGKFDYALFLPEEAIQPEQVGPFKLPGGLKAMISDKGFTAIVAGNIDDDPTVDVWWINDAKGVRHVVDDSSF